MGLTDPVADETVVEPQLATEGETVVDAGQDNGEFRDEADLAFRLPIEDYGNHVVPITVDGETRWVPLSEATSGYQRQADYTRKTQEIAEARKQYESFERFSQYLEADPESALRDLAKAVDLEVQFAAANPDTTPAVDDTELLTPEERELRELKAKVEAIEQERNLAQAEAEIRAQLDTLEAKHGVEREELLQFAMDNGIPPDKLEVAALALKGAKADITAEVASERQAAEQAAAAQREQAKRAAAFVSGGDSATLGAAASGSIDSFEDAFAEALAQHS